MITVCCPVKKQCFLATACYWDEDGNHKLHCRLEHHHRGDLVWCNQNEDSYAYILRSGIVTIERCDQAGETIVLNVLCKGQAFGLTGLFNRKIRPYYAAVCIETELCRVPLLVLERMIKSDPLVAERVILTLSEHLESLTHQVASLNSPHAFERIHSLLQQLAVKFSRLNGSAGDAWIKLPLTHQDLACLAGINRVTVTRTLHQMEDEGLVSLGKRKILVRLSDPVPAG